MAGGGVILGGGGAARKNVAAVTNSELHVRLSSIGGVVDVNIVSPNPLPVEVTGTVTLDDTPPIQVDIAAQSVLPFEVFINGTASPLPITFADEQPIEVTASIPLSVSLDAQSIPIEVVVAEPRTKLSDSTDGEALVVALTAGSTDVHTPANGVTDQIYLWVTNTSGVDDTIELDLGSTTFDMQARAPSNETVIILDGMPIGGNAGTGPTVRIRRLAAGSTVNVFGYVIATPA